MIAVNSRKHDEKCSPEPAPFQGEGGVALEGEKMLAELAQMGSKGAWRDNVFVEPPQIGQV